MFLEICYCYCFIVTVTVTYTYMYDVCIYQLYINADDFDFSALLLFFLDCGELSNCKEHIL